MSSRFDMYQRPMRNSSDASFIATFYRFGLVALLAGVVFLFVPGSVMPFEAPKIIFFRIFLGILLSIWSIHVLWRGSILWPKFKTVCQWGIFLIIASHVASFLNSADIARSFWGSFFRNSGLYTMIYYGGLFIFVITTNTKATWKFFETWIGILLFILSSINIWLFFITYHGDYRAAAFMGNPIYLGQFIVLLFPLTLSAIFTNTGKIKIFWMYTAFASGLTLILTGNRGSLVGLLFGLFVYGAGVFWKFHKKSFLSTVGVLVLIVITVLTVVNILYRGNTITNPVVQKFTFSTYESSQPIHTRFAIWLSTVQLVRDNLLFGVGHDMFDQTFKKYAPRALADHPIHYADRAHNIILDTLATFGLFGFIAYALFFGTAGKEGLIFFAKTKSPKDAYNLLGFMAGFVALFVAVQFNFLVLVNHVFFWTLLAFFFIFISGKRFLYLMFM